MREITRADMHGVTRIYTARRSNWLNRVWDRRNYQYSSFIWGPARQGPVNSWGKDTSERYDNFGRYIDIYSVRRLLWGRDKSPKDMFDRFREQTTMIGRR